MVFYPQSVLKDQIVTIFGGTGFVGRYIVAELAKAGARIRVATRNPQSAYFLRQYGDVGQIVPVFCAYRNEMEIRDVIRGSDVVINAVGILFERKSNHFSHIHTDLPNWMARGCAALNIPRFIHISALAVDRAASEYAVSKLSGEHAVTAHFPQATILRPSVVFGVEDQFFNKFAALANIAHVLPLIGGGKSKFQPVYVGDVARAVVASLKNPAAESPATESPATGGKIYQLGGPQVMSLKDIYLKIAEVTGRKNCLIPMPFWVMRIKAFFLGLLPHPPITNDQLTSMETDNVVSKDAPGLQDLGIDPTSVDQILPEYLQRYVYKR